MKKRLILICSLFISLTLFAEKVDKSRPNIIFIFADDMGIGDVSHTTGKVATPHLDRLAKEGLRFTDAHTSSSVCTPSRYSLLTGRYNWRTRLPFHVFVNPREKPLIKKNEKTVASLLKTGGYHTACIGKWHLGIGWQSIDGSYNGNWQIDYSKPAITPTTNGFDYFFGICGSLDMPPFLYIENELAVNPPSIDEQKKSKLIIGKDFKAVRCLQDFAAKSVEYIEERSKEDDPFFLYLPLTSPHTPIIPSKKWLGKSGIGKYGDFLMETDWVVGEVLRALDEQNLNENTLVLFSTDNGCSPAARIPELKAKGHSPNGNLRGNKADIYEGGHRVPFILRWPAVIKAGTVTDRLTCMTDFMPTCAEITKLKLDEDASVDGVSFLTTMKKPSYVKDRTDIIHHSINGSFSIRQGNWKLALCPGSGGWSAPKAGKTPPGSPKVQLFDLANDIEETKNVQAEYPNKVKELTTLLQQYVDKGRSNEGLVQKNDRPINIYAPDVPK